MLVTVHYSWKHKKKSDVSNKGSSFTDIWGFWPKNLYSTNNNLPCQFNRLACSFRKPAEETYTIKTYLFQSVLCFNFKYFYRILGLWKRFVPLFIISKYIKCWHYVSLVCIYILCKYCVVHSMPEVMLPIFYYRTLLHGWTCNYIAVMSVYRAICN